MGAQALAKDNSLFRTLKTSTELLKGAICHSQSQSAGPLGQFIYQADTKFSHWLCSQPLPTAFFPYDEILFPSATSFRLHKNAWRQIEQAPTIHFVNKEIEAQRGDKFCQTLQSSEGPSFYARP